MPRAAKREDEGHRGDDRQRRLHEQEALEVSMPAQGRSQQKGNEDAHESAPGADRDAGGAPIHGQVLTGELAHRAQHDRLRDRHDDLPGHRPGERLAAEAKHSTERDQRPARAQHRPKPSIQQDPGRDRQHDIQQGKDLGQPAHRSVRHPVAASRLGGDRGVGEP